MKNPVVWLALAALATALGFGLLAGADEPAPPPPEDKPPAEAPPAPDAPKPDEPKPDAPEPEEPRPEAPKADAPKPDEAKPDAPKPEVTPAKPALRYLGDKSCKTCHFTEHKSWSKLGHAGSLKLLQTVKEADDKKLFAARTKANLDPAKDYSKDEGCLACHTTGSGAPTGYSKDPAASEEADEVRASLGRVACEACHGPGEKYVEFKKANPGRKFTKAELTPLGLVEPDEKVCLECHNDKSPTAKPFSFAEMKTKIHEHKKKK